VCRRRDLKAVLKDPRREKGEKGPGDTSATNINKDEYYDRRPVKNAEAQMTDDWTRSG
jgi:hypothetical protein